MSNKKITVAVAGTGSRGVAYANALKALKADCEIVAIADPRPDRLEDFANRFGVKKEGWYNSAEEMLEQEKLADVMFICTMDKQHYAHAMTALEKGYHLLLEKPVSPDPKECIEIAQKANEKNLKVLVCHVLRYTNFYRKIKEIIDSGKLGRVLSVQANEQVCYWHQAHSFVRGNWRNEKESPMILQKCCHDMDILLWLTGKHCKSVSSFGTLSHFKKSEAPEGATERCTEDCPEYTTCPYSVKHCYIDRAIKGDFGWPTDVVEVTPSVDKLCETLKTSPYGRCVYYCDNDVVDHQVVNLLFEDDVTVSFNFTAFTSEGGRKIHVMGTKGDLVAYMEESEFTVTEYGKSPEKIVFKGVDDGFGHGGGDVGIMRDLIALLNGEMSDTSSLSIIDDSIESHLVCFAVDKSQKNNGALITMDDYKNGIK